MLPPRPSREPRPRLGGCRRHVYKWYTSLVYLTPLLGGWLADNFLGLRKSVIIGGVVMAIGHFLIAAPLDTMA